MKNTFLISTIVIANDGNSKKEQNILKKESQKRVAKIPPKLITKSSAKKYKLKDLLKKVDTKNLPKLVDFGPAVGKEQW